MLLLKIQFNFLILQTSISKYILHRSGHPLHPPLQRAKVLRARRQRGGHQRVLL